MATGALPPMAEHKTIHLPGDGHKLLNYRDPVVYWEELLGDKVIRIHCNALVFPPHPRQPDSTGR